MNRKELEAQMRAVLMPLAPEEWLIERCCNVAETYSRQQNGIKPNVVSSAYMVLMGKEHGNVFWTTGGEYRTDWYELLFHSDSEDEVRDFWRKHTYRW